MKALRGGLRLRILLRFFDRLSPNTLGILAMMGAMAAFAFGDALMKLSTEQMPAGESIFLRGIMAATMIWTVAIRSGAINHIGMLANRYMPYRTAGDMGGTFLFIPALPYMPLAEAAAILQTNPLAVTAAAAVFLGEKVGWRRWSATAIGFLGALLIIQPGSSSFTWASISIVACVASAVTRDIATRKLIGVPNVLITATAVTATLIASTAFAAFETWRLPGVWDFVRLSAAAVLMLGGQMLVVTSIRSGDVSAVVPFRYSAMLWTLLLSAVIWRYVPNFTTMLGIVIVAGAGLYTFFREQTLKRRAAEQAQAQGGA